MSTRYVWGRYTRTTQTYPVYIYRAVESNIDTDSAWVDIDSSNGYQFYIGSGYRIQQSTGTLILTGYSNYVGGYGSNGKVFGSGYMDSYGESSGDIFYYGISWTQRDQIGGVGFHLEPSGGATQITTQLYQDYEVEYVRGTLVGYSSSSSRSAHPDNQWDGTYWYVYSGQDSIDPAGVSIPDEITGGTSIVVSVSPGSGKTQGGTVSYSYQYKFGDNGAWSSLITTTATQYMLAIPIGTTNVQVRIQARDDIGFTSSDYYYSDTVEVVNGNPPSITSDLGQSPYDMGKITEPFTFNYTVSDQDYNDRLTVYELLASEDESFTGGIERTNVSPGTTIEYGVFDYLASEGKITEEAVFQLLPHDVLMAAGVYAEDSYKNQSNVFVVNFTKVINEITITFKKPLTVEGNISSGVIYTIGYIPEDAEFNVKATNNANDDEPIWQDVTYEVNHQLIFEFDNVEAQKGFAFNFLLHAKRGRSNEGGYIDTIMGAFE